MDSDVSDFPENPTLFPEGFFAKAFPVKSQYDHLDSRMVRTGKTNILEPVINQLYIRKR